MSWRACEGFERFGTKLPLLPLYLFQTVVSYRIWRELFSIHRFCHMMPQRLKMALTGLGTWIRVRCVEMVVFVSLLHESHCNARKKKTNFFSPKRPASFLFLFLFRGWGSLPNSSIWALKMSLVSVFYWLKKTWWNLPKLGHCVKCFRFCCSP